jgi:UDP-N-acetylmuramyl pentapeptide phosphotransferase/UDP-N-acetylglucosamine-1-phosphate transferase
MTAAGRGRRPATVLSGVVAAAATPLLIRGLRARPPGGASRWSRTNHAGHPISLLEGPGYVLGAGVGAAAGSLLAPGAGPALLAASGAGAAGLLDDLAGDSTNKGLRGHLGALRQGRVTTGALKIAALAATGLASAALTDRRDHRALGPATLLGGAVIAGSANLANLLDLRPGRALKASVLAGIPLALAGERAAAAAVGAALGALPADLARETMLGDTGANAAGALIGSALVARTGLGGRAVALAALTALTLASERVSFTQVIESTPVLREIDSWGRR